MFARDPSAMDFLTSGIGIRGGLQIQQGFAHNKTIEDLENIVQDYTRCGNDRGVTEKCIRQACGVKPVEQVDDAGLDTILNSSQDQNGTDRENHLIELYNHYLPLLLHGVKDKKEWHNTGHDHMTKGWLHIQKTPDTIKNKKQSGRIFARMKNDGL